MGKRTSENWQDWGKDYAVAMTELRRSGAAGTHDSRANRRRQRGQDKRAAIREQY